MMQEYIQAALKKANYKIIDDENPYYAEIEVINGVWAHRKLFFPYSDLSALKKTTGFDYFE